MKTPFFIIVCALSTFACEAPDTSLRTRTANLTAFEVQLLGAWPAGVGGIGQSLALGGGYILAGAPLDSSMASNAGSLLVWDGLTPWPNPVRSPNAQANELFGQSIAFDAGHVAVGLPGAQGGMGRLEVYDVDELNSELDFHGPAVPVGLPIGLGFSVALNGSTLVGGAPASNRAFAFDAVTLNQLASLDDPAITAGDGFGAAVATNGQLVAVGAPQADGGAGKVVIFDRTAGFAQVGSLQFSGTGGSFGASLSMFSDMLAVGAPDEGTGAVYVYEHRGNGDFGELRRLTTVDGPKFGISVMLRGVVLLVGAEEALNSVSGGATGQAELFLQNRGGADNFGREHVFESSASAPGDRFGHVVAVDAPIVAIGAPGSDMFTIGAGGVHSFGTDLPMTVQEEDPPVPEADSVTTDEDVAVTIDVLANDAYMAPANVFVATEPDEGTAAVAENSIVYTPPPDWSGTIEFRYSVTDSTGLEGEAGVTVIVDPVNDPPTFDPLPAPIEATVGDIVTFSVTASDVDDTPVISLVEAPVSAVLTDGDFRWDTTGAEAADYGIELEASDGEFADTATVRVTLVAQVTEECAAECDAGESCFGGACFQQCESTDACESGSCFVDRCARDACDGVTCGPDESCYAGACFALCTRDEECPADEDCFAGRCTADPCDLVQCAKESICYQGGCFEPCDESLGCAQEESCFSGRCATQACDRVQCRASELCVGGTCFPGCSEDAHCGAGHQCFDGRCVEDPCDDVMCDGDDVCEQGKCVDVGGCSCSSAGGGSASPLVLLAFAAFRRRRSRSRER